MPIAAATYCSVTAISHALEELVGQSVRSSEVCFSWMSGWSRGSISFKYRPSASRVKRRNRPIHREMAFQGSASTPHPAVRAGGAGDWTLPGGLLGTDAVSLLGLGICAVGVLGHSRIRRARQAWTAMMLKPADALRS